ncbi:uncharacterized protein LY79DRAFT_674702 [Colletotrichum navitas]|uniref:Amine oxidase n=1 Tax=Colletotrichum navitas TaxID=681940 RepID=A0AAD8PLC9_9PEZI|nr:uncharacterized protein LY79DRAFT_674702 [Colletotrichum navitas]KAK1569397.1 hypothetical protein LY79DRAFT_674702 [Colletotrichum navitas]
MSEIFLKAQAELSSDSSVLFSSEVVKAHRPNNDSDVKLVVRTPTGTKLIIAKKLAIAIPPKKSVFSKYIDAGYYVGALKNSGFLENASISNAAEGNTKYDLPFLPAAYSSSASRIPGVPFTTYSTPETSESEPLTDEEVKTDIINTAKRILKQNPDLFEKTEPEFVAFHAHSPANREIVVTEKNSLDETSLLPLRARY